MAYAHSIVTARDVLPGKAKPAPQAKRGLFRRFVAAMQEARMRAAEREIAAYLARSGGRFTDEQEREIERRFLSNSGL
jgi:hypothetical protein